MVVVEEPDVSAVPPVVVAVEPDPAEDEVLDVLLDELLHPAASSSAATNKRAVTRFMPR